MKIVVDKNAYNEYDYVGIWENNIKAKSSGYYEYVEFMEDDRLKEKKEEVRSLAKYLLLKNLEYDKIKEEIQKIEL